MTKQTIYYTSDFMPQGAYEIEEDTVEGLLATGQWSLTPPVKAVPLQTDSVSGGSDGDTGRRSRK